MEELAFSSSSQQSRACDVQPVAWRDLREWLRLVEGRGQLKQITAKVDPDEELGAITFMAAAAPDSPALLFDNLAGDRFGARVLTNMLGASKERYAVSVGLDPGLATQEMIAATRAIMKRRIKSVKVPKDRAPVNEVVLTGDRVDLTGLPIPKFWPGDGGRCIGTGDITLTRDPETSRINVGVYRQMLHGPTRVGLYCSPGKHGRLDREAWWTRGEPCEVVAAYGIDPVLFMIGTQTMSAAESELDIAGGIMGRPVKMTDAEFVGLPIPAHAEFVIEGILHPGASNPWCEMSQSLSFRKHAVHCVRVAPTRPENERPVMLQMAQHWLSLAEIAEREIETSQPAIWH